MANTINNINEVGAILARAAAETLRDNLVFGKTISKADASEFDGKNGYKAGQTIKINKPPRFIPQDTFDITSSKRDIVEETADLTLDIQKTVGMEIDSLELAYEVDIKRVIERFVKPAAESIAQHVEQVMIERATDATYNSTGTAGSNSFTVADVLAGRTKLNQSLAPNGNRHFLLNSQSGAAAVDARKGLFQDSTQVSKQYLEGMVGRADGFDWYENELINVHTNGTDVTGALINGTISEGASSLTIDGLSASATVTKGTVFTIANVNKVHPITKVDLGVLQQFVVTADATANGSGEATISISPAVRAGSAGLQNVTALPADNAALTFVGAASTAYAQNLQYHRDAFKMVSVPLIMPKNAELAAQETVDGFTVAIVRDFDVNTRTMITRLDFLGGISAVRPEWANRVTA